MELARRAWICAADQDHRWRGFGPAPCRYCIAPWRTFIDSKVDGRGFIESSRAITYSANAVASYVDADSCGSAAARDEMVAAVSGSRSRSGLRGAADREPDSVEGGLDGGDERRRHDCVHERVDAAPTRVARGRVRPPAARRWMETSWAGHDVGGSCHHAGGALGERGQQQAVPADEGRDDVAVVVDELPGLRHVGAGVLDVADVVDLAGEPRRRCRERG